MKATRGIRLNNPGNIEKGDKWVGLTADQPDSRFCQFKDAKYGIRAMVKLLRKYDKSYGVDTIREIITRYAPAHENKTDKYIENVAKWTGFDPDKELNPFNEATLVPLIKAIIRQENGYCPYNNDKILEGIRAA